jgi:hypothetical protein
MTSLINLCATRHAFLVAMPSLSRSPCGMGVVFPQRMRESEVRGRSHSSALTSLSLSLLLCVCVSHRGVANNRLTGTVPPQLSALTNLGAMCARHDRWMGRGGGGCS